MTPINDVGQRLRLTKGRRPSPPDLRALLAREVRAAARELRAPATSKTLAPLRRVQYWCDRFATQTETSEDRFLFFTLSLLINDVFANLAGDVPYDEESEKHRQAFFGALSDEFHIMGEKMGTSVPNDYLASLCRVVDNYFLTIHELNKITTRDKGENRV